MLFSIVSSCNSSSIDFIIINSYVNTFDSNYTVSSVIAIDDGIFTGVGGDEITKIYQFLTV